MIRCSEESRGLPLMGQEFEKEWKGWGTAEEFWGWLRGDAALFINGGNQLLTVFALAPKQANLRSFSPTT